MVHIILVTVAHCVVLTCAENISNYEGKVFVLVACRLLDMEFYLDHRIMANLYECFLLIDK